MRIKKGFTLAEILIVLMVIGVIATMTVPSLMKGVNDATYKTAFKKAYNTVTNIAAVAKISGELPASATNTSAFNFFKTLDSNLSVKEYSSKTLAQSDGNALASSEGKGGVKYNSVNFGSTTSMDSDVSLGAESPWLITEDGFAYKVLPAGTSGSCGNKADVMATANQDPAAKKACLLIAVDVNGLFKGPNIFEPQVKNEVVKSTGRTELLVGDRYYIFVANDGTSTGDKRTTISGRILNDIK